MDVRTSHYRAWITSYVKQHWYLLAGLALLALISVGIGLLAPVPLKFLADYVFGNETPPSFISGIGKQQLLLIVVGAYLCISIAENLFNAAEDVIQVRFNQIIDKKVMLEAFGKTNSISIANPNRKDNGAYIYQITQQSQQLSSYILGNSISIFKSLITIISVLSILTFIDVRMTLLCLASIPALVLLVKYFGDLVEKRANSTEIAHSAVYEFIEETLSKLRTVQVFAKENFSIEKLTGIINNRNKKANQMVLANNAFSFSSEFVVLIVISIVLVIGGRDVINGNLTFGDLLLFITYMNSVFDPLSNIVDVLGGARQQKAALQIVDSSLASAEAISTSRNSKPASPQKIHGEIKLKNLTYKIGGSVLFNNANAHFTQGSINALVGPSGHGKSTLLNMLLGFINPNEGTILIDGTPLNQYDPTVLRENIAMIDQEPDIFNMSIRENIAYANPSTPNNLPDIMAAAVVSNSSEFIEHLPEKYEALSGNDRLSGGQKQRLAIARAYYKRAPVVLMDEPTSALDKSSAQKFINSLEQYYVGQTVILITHDLALLEKIPNIYVVDNQTITPIEQVGGLPAYKQKIIADR